MERNEGLPFRYSTIVGCVDERDKLTEDGIVKDAERAVIGSRRRRWCIPGEKLENCGMQGGCRLTRGDQALYVIGDPLMSPSPDGVPQTPEICDGCVCGHMSCWQIWVQSLVLLYEVVVSEKTQYKFKIVVKVLQSFYILAMKMFRQKTRPFP
jgi:hypothetical protein